MRPGVAMLVWSKTPVSAAVVVVPVCISLPEFVEDMLSSVVGVATAAPGWPFGLSVWPPSPASGMGSLQLPLPRMLSAGFSALFSFC